MTIRREKGLCNNCDEKFSSNHKCKGRFFLLVADTDADDDADLDPPPVEPLPPSPVDNSEVQISFNALSGTPAPETLRLYGGSTHNFIH